MSISDDYLTAKYTNTKGRVKILYYNVDGIEFSLIPFTTVSITKRIPERHYDLRVNYDSLRSVIDKLNLVEYSRTVEKSPFGDVTTGILVKDIGFIRIENTPGLREDLLVEDYDKYISISEEESLLDKYKKGKDTADSLKHSSMWLFSKEKSYDIFDVDQEKFNAFDLYNIDYETSKKIIVRDEDMKIRLTEFLRVINYNNRELLDKWSTRTKFGKSHYDERDVFIDTETITKLLDRRTEEVVQSKLDSSVKIGYWFRDYRLNEGKPFVLQNASNKTTAINIAIVYLEEKINIMNIVHEHQYNKEDYRIITFSFDGNQETDNPDKNKIVYIMNYGGNYAACLF